MLLEAIQGKKLHLKLSSREANNMKLIDLCMSMHLTIKLKKARYLFQCFNIYIAVICLCFVHY